MEGIAGDADFFSLLREIECADARSDALDDKAPDSNDLIDLFLDESEPAAASPNTGACLTSDASDSVVATSSASHAERCRLNRKRKKQELQELRAAATTLEATLAKLSQPRSTPSSSSLWREASRLTLVESRRSIAENKRLREMLKKHWAAAQHIQQAIRSAPEFEALESTQLVETSERLVKRLRDETSVPPPSRGIYSELFRKIHSAYEEKDLVEEMAWLKIGVRKISMDLVSQAGGTDTSIRVMECQRLPFSLAYVSEATWRHLSTPCAPSCDTKDEICGRTTLTTFGDDMFGECGPDCSSLPANDAMPAGRLAIRRYVEPNRLTFVWECDGCYQCDGSKKPIGRVSERGWCTVEPSDDSATSTVFRIQVQYVPHTNEPAIGRCCPARASLSSDVALDLYRRTVARTFGAVEREVFHQDNQTCRATV